MIISFACYKNLCRGLQECWADTAVIMRTEQGPGCTCRICFGGAPPAVHAPADWSDTSASVQTPAKALHRLQSSSISPVLRFFDELSTCARCMLQVCAIGLMAVCMCSQRILMTQDFILPCHNSPERTRRCRLTAVQCSCCASLHQPPRLRRSCLMQPPCHCRQGCRTSWSYHQLTQFAAQSLPCCLNFRLEVLMFQLCTWQCVVRFEQH